MHFGVGEPGAPLAKRVCGSCRFFKEAREGKQGWCTHPERQESSSVRILVRAAELRCRDDWGHDKWEPQIASDQVLDVVMNDPDAPRLPMPDRRYIPPVERVVPEAEEPLALHATPMRPIDDFSEPEERNETSHAVSADLNRELLRQARAQFRDRQRNKRYSVPQVRDSEPEPLVISNQYIPPSRDLPSSNAESRANPVFEFEQRGDDAFDAVPNFAGEPDVSLERYDGPGNRLQAGSFATETPQGVTRREERRGDSAITRPVPDVDQEPDMRTNAFSVEAADQREYDMPTSEAVAFSIPETDFAIEDWDPARQRTRPSEATSLWVDIPKCCLTCRDFRPAGNGERGWCTNKWAFKHRRMVDANDRPCETSIGHWWIPGDAAWQGDFDISALGQPTPLMDKWFGRAGVEAPVDAPVERRRRKTGSW